MILAFFNYHLKWTVQIVFGSWVTSGVYVVKCVGAKIKNTHFQLFHFRFSCHEYNVNVAKSETLATIPDICRVFYSPNFLNLFPLFWWVLRFRSSLWLTYQILSPFYQGLRGDYTLYPERLSKLKRRTLVATEKRTFSCTASPSALRSGFRPEMCSGPLRK